MDLGALPLKAGQNQLTLTLAEGDPPVKIRIDRIELSPVE
jgi:hypothetical protein